KKKKKNKQTDQEVRDREKGKKKEMRTAGLEPAGSVSKAFLALRVYRFRHDRVFLVCILVVPEFSSVKIPATAGKRLFLATDGLVVPTCVCSAARERATNRKTRNKNKNTN